jgi:V8-like Glu-specific endopeptidase
VDFNFDDDKEGILAASRATSLLLVELIDAKNVKTWQFATAFFVAPNILLTAGHVVYEPKDGGKIDRYLFMPGDPFLDMDKVSQKAPHAIRCTVAENTWKPKGPMFKDIAVLSSGSFETKNFVPISCDAIPINAIIDVVGYPGEKRSNWLREKHPGLKSLVDSTRTSEAMLPTGKLVVTRGVVEETCGDMTSYKISTCPGLSGSCVVYKGKVHGNLVAPVIRLTL